MSELLADLLEGLIFVLAKEARDRGIDIISEAQRADFEEESIEYMKEVNEEIEVKEAESVETKETSVVSKSDDLPLEITIIEDHTTTLKTETIKLQNTQDENFAPSEEELTKPKLELEAGVIEPKPEPALLTNVLDEVCVNKIDDGNLASLIVVSVQNGDIKNDEKTNDKPGEDEDGNDKQDSFKTPIPPEPPPIFINATEKDIGTRPEMGQDQKCVN